MLKLLYTHTHTHTHVYTLPLKVFKNKQGPGGGTLTLATEVNSSEDATYNRKVTTWHQTLLDTEFYSSAVG